MEGSKIAQKPIPYPQERVQEMKLCIPNAIIAPNLFNHSIEHPSTSQAIHSLYSSLSVVMQIL